VPSRQLLEKTDLYWQLATGNWLRRVEASMRDRGFPIARWTWAVVLTGLMAHGVSAQSPDPAGVPPGPAACNRRGTLHRMFHHTAHTLEDKFIGYPETFIEPPLGFYVNRQLAVQVAKADPHRFTLYRSDLLPGTD